MSNKKENFALTAIKRIHHELNAESSDGKLEAVIKIIAEETKVDSADLYIKADDVSLEHILSHPKNLTKSAVRIGEGVIGKSGADNRTSFVKTKSNFKIALPLKKWNKAIGVLCISYPKSHDYNEEEVESLETVCMFLSEFIASEEISQYIKKIIKSRGLDSKDKLKGTIINSGYGLGNAVVHRRRQAVTKVFAKDKDKEIENLTNARQRMNEDLEERFNQESLSKGEHLEILDAYRMIANDKGWYNRITNHINSGLTAEAAVEQAYSEMWNRLSGSADAYLKERLHDLRDIADRLRLYLSGKDCNTDSANEYEDIIIIATSMGPADLMDYDYKKIRGLIIEDCTPTMHVSIVAKALGVPIISGIEGLFKDVKEGVLIGIDGSDGGVYVKPPHNIIDKITQKVEEKRRELRQIQKLKNLKSKTKDMERINLYINIGMDFDLDYIKSTNCDGVGLYRTEIPFMSTEKMPDLNQQVECYKKIYKAAGDKKIVFRSLDVGSDKLLPYWNSITEDNPAIGWRSIRITLDRRAILRKQMRAFIQAASGKELNVMFPMIANLDEFLEAKETFMLAYEREKHQGYEMPKKVNIGLMIEVPSVVFQLKEICKHCDFVSVGTNDLCQFFFACDRGNPRLNGRYDVLSTPFLNVMKEIITETKNASVLCSVCGEMASSPLDAMALIGLGYRNLSVSGSSYGKVKAMICSLNVKEIEDYINNILPSNKNLRAQLKSYATDHNIEIY